MKYLVESNKERQAEPPVFPTDAFFQKYCSKSEIFSHHQNICKVKNICDCVWSGNNINFRRNKVYAFIRVFLWISRWTWNKTKPRLWCKFCFNPDVRICATEIVYFVQYGYIRVLSTVPFSVKYVINFLLFLAAVSVFFNFNNIKLKCTYRRQVASFSTCDIGSRNVVFFFSNPFKSSEANKWIGAWTF